MLGRPALASRPADRDHQCLCTASVLCFLVELRHCFFKNLMSNRVDLSLVFRAEELLTRHQLGVVSTPGSDERGAIGVSEGLRKASTGQSPVDLPQFFRFQGA